jgi:hypothetical protein
MSGYPSSWTAFEFCDRFVRQVFLVRLGELIVCEQN